MWMVLITNAATHAMLLFQRPEVHWKEEPLGKSRSFRQNDAVNR
jgi:hypothetical protein